MRRQILVRAPLDRFSGYGRYATALTLQLVAKGFNVGVYPTQPEFETDPRLPFLDNLKAEFDLVIHPPDDLERLYRHPNSVVMTMWESTRLKPEWLTAINRYKAVMVPSTWNASCFSAQGVSIPIYAVPLGVDSCSIPAKSESKRPFVFGAAGAFASGGQRKGLENCIHYFQKAFPDRDDVRLHVKLAGGGEHVRDFDDTRIKMQRGMLDAKAMLKWYQRLHCFISAAKCEGWGLHQHESMSAGKPVISIQFAGMAEFFDEAVGFPVKFRLVPSQGLYENLGYWAEPDEGHFIDTLRYAYEHPNEVVEKGRKAVERAKAFSIEASAKKVIEVLRRHFYEI